MNKLLTPLLLCCLLWLVATGVYAENVTAILKNIDKPFDLNPYVETIEDPHHEYTLEDIQAGKYDHLWQQNTVPHFVGSNLKSKYWFRLTLNWQGAEQQASVLYIPNQPSSLFRIGILLPNAQGSSTLITTGSLEPYHSRDIDSTQYSFNLSLAPNEPTSVFGWISNAETALPPMLPLYLVSAGGYDSIQDQVEFIQVAFYAVMAALWFYNLCLYVTLREPVYGLYILFLASAALACATVDGSSQRWMLMEAPDLNVRISATNGVFMTMVYLAFVVHALNGVSFWPRFKLVYRTLLFCGFIALILCLVSPKLSVSAVITQGLLGFIFLVALVSIIQAIREKQPTAIYLLIAEIMTITGASSYMLMINGIVSINLIATWGMHWGVLIEALLLSLALAARTRLAQQSAIENLKKYETIYTDSIEGFFNYDLASNELKCNRAFAKLFGYADVNEMPVANSPLGHFDISVQTELPQLLVKAGYITHYEAQVLSPKLNSPIWVSINMRLVKNEKGRALRTEGSMVNITDRKLGEIAEKNGVAAEARNQAKSQFFASMSHELRTPLTAILGYSEVALGEEIENKMVKDALNIIHRGGQHLLQIINDILDLAKIEAQKLDVESIQVYIQPLLEDIQTTMEFLAKQKGLVFTIRYHYPLPKIITSDPTRLKQILLNLCGNAIKFTQKGTVTVTVSCDRENELMSFTIEDTGFGLKADQVENLFAAFTQADASTTRNYGGTGLGLHLSKQLAQKLGGDITVASVYGEGSIFTLSITTDSLQNIEWLEADFDSGVATTNGN